MREAHPIDLRLPAPRSATAGGGATGASAHRRQPRLRAASRSLLGGSQRIHPSVTARPGPLTASPDGHGEELRESLRWVQKRNEEGEEAHLHLNPPGATAAAAQLGGDGEDARTKPLPFS